MKKLVPFCDACGLSLDGLLYLHLAGSLIAFDTTGQARPLQIDPDTDWHPGHFAERVKQVLA